nr:MAG TPA: hypothetical protein [Caudoviricetes sp.]
MENSGPRTRKRSAFVLLFWYKSKNPCVSRVSVC